MIDVKMCMRCMGQGFTIIPRDGAREEVECPECEGTGTIVTKEESDGGDV